MTPTWSIQLFHAIPTSHSAFKSVHYSSSNSTIATFLCTNITFSHSILTFNSIHFTCIYNYILLIYQAFNHFIPFTNHWVIQFFPSNSRTIFQQKLSHFYVIFSLIHRFFHFLFSNTQNINYFFFIHNNIISSNLIKTHYPITLHCNTYYITLYSFVAHLSTYYSSNRYYYLSSYFSAIGHTSCNYFFHTHTFISCNFIHYNFSRQAHLI